MSGDATSICMGLLAGGAVFVLAQVIFVLAWTFAGRLRQAGREGHGYEHKGVQRWKTAFYLWRLYDLEDFLP